MLEKFKLWFICFGLSFLVESIGWAEQGKAFLFIDLGATGLIIAYLILGCIFAGDSLEKQIVIPVIAKVVVYGAVIAIILFATWGATKLFNVDYYVAFQIMSFGQCLYSSNKKNKKNKKDD